MSTTVRFDNSNTKSTIHQDSEMSAVDKCDDKENTVKRNQEFNCNAKPVDMSCFRLGFFTSRAAGVMNDLVLIAKLTIISAGKYRTTAMAIIKVAIHAFESLNDMMDMLFACINKSNIYTKTEDIEMWFTSAWSVILSTVKIVVRNRTKINEKPYSGKITDEFEGELLGEVYKEAENMMFLYYDYNFSKIDEYHSLGCVDFLEKVKPSNMASNYSNIDLNLAVNSRYNLTARDLREEKPEYCIRAGEVYSSIKSNRVDFNDRLSAAMSKIYRTDTPINSEDAWNELKKAFDYAFSIKFMIKDLISLFVMNEVIASDCVSDVFDLLNRYMKERFDALISLSKSVNTCYTTTNDDE